MIKKLDIPQDPQAAHIKNEDNDFLNFDDYPDYFILEQAKQQNQIQDQIYLLDNLSDSEKSDNKQEFQSQEENEQQEEIFDSDSDDSFEEINTDNIGGQQDLKQGKAPKHLYDCLLGLRSEDKTRIEQSLKHLNYLIRKNLDDLELLWEDLALQLITLHSIDSWCYNFDTYRSRALVSLCILKPEQLSKILIDRFYSEKSSLGDKHFIVGILNKSAVELSSNPSRYQTEKMNEYDEKQDNAFYFQKLETKYLNQYEEQKKQQKAVEDAKRQEKIGQKSKRWGQTRINYELSQQQQQEEEQNQKLLITPQNQKNLQKIKKQDLIICKPKSENIFINRFNQQISNFFFPLIVPLRNKNFEQYKKQILLLTQIVQIIIVYIDAGVNCHQFYNIIEESLLFILKYDFITDVNFTRVKLQALMKITILVKQEQLFQYPLVVRYIVQISQALASKNLKDEVDPNNKALIQIILSNIQNLFNFQQIQI